MRKVVVECERLLDAVRGNREKHEAEYEEACEHYRQQAAAAFGAKQAEANEGGLPDPRIDLKKPVHFLDQYDQAIEMLKMEQREKIELTEDEFQKLVLDEWNWSNQFERRTSSYT